MPVRSFMIFEFAPLFRRPLGALAPGRHFCSRRLIRLKLTSPIVASRMTVTNSFRAIPGLRGVARQIAEAGVGGHQLCHHDAEQGPADAQAHAGDDVGQGARKADLISCFPTAQAQRSGETPANRVKFLIPAAVFKMIATSGDFEDDDHFRRSCRCRTK